jgi:hypothetical protein
VHGVGFYAQPSNARYKLQITLLYFIILVIHNFSQPIGTEEYSLAQYYCYCYYYYLTAIGLTPGGSSIHLHTSTNNTRNTVEWGRGVDHPRHVAPSLKKEYTFTYTSPVAHRGLF